MPIDLNMDMGAIIKGLMARKGNGRNASGSAGGLPLEQYKFAIIILLLIVIIAAGYISFVYLPLKAKNNLKKEELAKVMEMKNQLSVLDGQIKMLKKKLDKSKEQYLESLAHFGNSEDLGGIYQTISTLATKYAIEVMNVKDVPIPPPAPAPKPTTTDAKGAAPAPVAPKKPAIEVKEIKVEVELKGHYGDYIKFKEDLALAETLLKINSETVAVKDDKNDPGSIYIKLNISTYAIDKKPFKGIIAEDSHEKNK
jgi:peroxiredoxin family protein